MQNQAKKETESLEQISERLKELMAEAYDAIPKTHPAFEGYCYFSVYRSGGGSEIQFHIAGLKGADFTAATLPDAVALVKEFNPETERQKKIATLKAELATLEGGSK